MDRHASDGTAPRATIATSASAAGVAQAAWLAAAAVALAAFVIRLVGLDHTPHFDEIYHVLAGESLLRDGTLRLSPDGPPYGRARLFTFLVAGSMALFGETLVAARIPAAIAGALLAGAVYLSVRRYGDPLAAGLAAGLVALAPTDLYLSQLARFYSLHALLIWGVAMGVFALAAGAARPDRRGVAIALATVAGLAIAYHLQPSAALACGAMAVAAAPVAAWTHRRRLRRVPRRAWAAAIAAAGVALVWFALAGPAGRWFAGYRNPGSIVIGRDPSARYYFDYFGRLFGVLWAAFPVLAAIAVTRRARFVTYLAMFALVSFTAVSLSTWRHERYVYFALPAVYAVAALGLSTAFRWLRDAWEARLLRGGQPAARARRAAFAIAAASALAAAAFAAPTVDAAAYTYRMLTVSDADWWLGGHFRGEADWERAARSLAGMDLPHGAVVASSPNKAAYYLGDIDYILLARAVPRVDGRFQEPGLDRQWNRPEVASADAVAAVMACRPSGVFVIERREWRRPQGVPDATADRIEGHARALAVPPDTRVMAFAWGPGDAPAAPPAGWSCGPDGRASRD